MMQPFSIPKPATTLSLSATTSSGRGVLAGTGNQMLVMNAGTQGAYIAVGDVTVVATSADVFVAGNTSMVFTIPPETTNAATITPTGTTTMLFARGSGA